MYRLTKTQLLKDLYKAFFGARQHKANAPYVTFYERNLKDNLQTLCDVLWNRTYKPKPSRCFIIEYPKKREVFAADFEDRIVHHLYFEYTHKLFENTFIHDTYSCIENRGTLYGIKRLRSHILKESQNYSLPCYIMKYDIRGYFMHINREKLSNIAITSIVRMSEHDYNGKLWKDVIDIDFVLWLTKEIAMLNPTYSCIKVGGEESWNGLDENKSLFNSPEGCGLPIGNLTSQLFSNVYLNVFDQFMKQTMKFKHYGRYVDDAFAVSCDKQHLLDSVVEIKSFLKDKLGLELHMGKLKICKAEHGVEFLGAYILPHRIYISNDSLRRMRSKIALIDFNDTEKVFKSTNSYLGSMVHYASYNIRKEIFYNEKFQRVAEFDNQLTKMIKYG